MSQEMTEDLPAVRKAIASCVWRETSYIQPHSYIVRQRHPEAFALLHGWVQRTSVPGLFQGATYRYAYLDGYKYWIIDNICNREALGPVPEDGR